MSNKKKLKYSKLQKKLNKNKAKSKNIYILKKVSIFLLIFVFISSLILFFTKAKVLRVELRGLKVLNPIDIIEEAQLAKYNNISLFNIPKKDIKLEIEKNNRLEVENIKISFPDLLIINLKERETLYLLESNTGIYEITDEGYIIKSDFIYNYNVPYITGLNINPTNIKVENDYTKYLTSVIAEVKSNNYDIYNLISEINAYGQDLIFYPRGYQVQVILEKYVKASKFVELAAVLKTIRNQAEKTYRIDFRFNEVITVN